MIPVGRVLGIDYGEKRIGIALSDPIGIFSKPLAMIPNRGLDFVLSELKQLIDLHSVVTVVVGMPYAIDGSDTPKTLECKAFMERLAANLDIPVLGFDERYSTCEAEAELKMLGYTWQETRKLKDSMAACLILKEYLASV